MLEYCLREALDDTLSYLQCVFSSGNRCMVTSDPLRYSNIPAFGIDLTELRYAIGRSAQ
jgi:hypothetical protein